MSALEEKFVAAGNDYASLSERTFGDEALIAQLMQIFLQDDSFKIMRQSMDNGETEAAFKAAHSLKGSCGMLGLTPLFEIMKIITDKLRYGDLEGAEKVFPQTSEEYEKAIALIKELISTS